MADDKLRWAFELFDKMSGPADKITKSLSNLNIAVGDNSSLVVNMGKAAESTGANLGGWLSVLEKIASVLAAIGKGLMSFAEMAVDALAFKESTLKSFELMEHSGKAAKEMWEEAFELARLTPFETEDVAKAFKQLRAAGFSRKEVPIVFQALGDVASASGFDKEVMPGIATQMAQAMAKGKLQMDDLKPMLNYLGSAGISMDAIFGKIAGHLHVAKTNVSQMMAEGRISSKVGIFSILETIKEQGGGTIGNTMLTQGLTLKALLVTLKGAATDFWLSMDLDNFPGFETFKSAIQNLLTILDPRGPSGSKITAFFKQIFNEGAEALFGDFAGEKGVGNLEKALTGALTVARFFWVAVKSLGAVFGAIFDGIRESMGADTLGQLFDPKRAETFGTLLVFIGHMLGQAIGGVFNLLGKFNDFVTGQETLSDKLRPIWIDAGKAIIDGLKQGITDNMPGLQPIMVALAGSVFGPFSNILGIHSPSKVFEEYGENITQGLTMGLDSGNASVKDAMGNIAMKPGASGSGGARGPVTLNLSIGIDNRGHLDAEDLARKLEDLLPSRLAALFDQLAAEGGVA